ncbi:Putative zinc-finger [Thermanaeromonas toyohensis ToBE]|uniref:Anti-sigma-W factor RsiW n=1 Tax=Thermanaeromonas toyohensis ToBE TaxID=698762 RepID=A0A1W1V9B6_9FIRM|nr:zf-HC2 domain-containing protein [Thermanaeromonas toyohensis]SMB89875.1 Putative zinc-finger [Thermanaeromonas toyohensis ToBE]
MRCWKARKLLSPYIDGELGEEERSSLEGHLANCPACQEELEALRKISEGLKDIYRQVKPPAGFAEGVMARIKAIEEASASPWQLQEKPLKWRKVAVAAALVAGIGLAVLQYGRAGIGGPAGAPLLSGNIAAPGSLAVEEKVRGEAPSNSLGEREKIPVVSNPGAKEGDRLLDQKKEGQSKGKKTYAGVETVPKAGLEAGPLVKQEKQGQVASSSVGSPAVGGKAELKPQLFLSKELHVRTTLLKLEVKNLPYAKEVVLALAEKFGGSQPKEVWVYQQEEVLLRVVLPVEKASGFISQVVALGKEMARERSTVDLTGEYNRRLLEYQELEARQDPESEAMARALKNYLEETGQETLEAGKEVINVWLKLQP